MAVGVPHPGRNQPLNRGRPLRDVAYGGDPVLRIAADGSIVVSESEPPRRWEAVIKVAVEAADEAEARRVVDLVVAAMDITVAAAPPFVQFDDGTWATEMTVAEPVFDESETYGAVDVLSALTANLGPVTWRGVSDTPFDPDSARAAQEEWPPGFWALAGRRETLVQSSVRAMLLQSHLAASPASSP
jgi:hypothetical protein